MAGGSIKGITIEFRGETTKLSSALRQVNKETAQIDRELKNVDKALKFNPGSIDLWREKQTLLTKKVSETKEKLELLKKQQQAMDDANVDKESLEYQKLQREIVETTSKLKKFEADLRKVGNVKLKALGEQFKAIGSKVTAIGKDITTKVTVPLAAAGAVAVSKFAEVDKTMQLTNATMGNTEAEAQLLNKAMKEAAANSTYGMADAATATLNFARSGLSATEAADALAPAMALAAGEGGNLDTVSAGLTATINGFGDSFDKTAEYADVFANACNNSALDVDSLSSAMSVAAPIFAAAGFKVNDAALYMGIMANNGIDADKAANSLKTGLARLVSPAKQGAAMMDELGISITNTDGTMKDTVTIQKELHDAFAKLSESEQIAAASAIFGKNQMAPWLALINTAPEDVENLNTALGENGTALEMQSAMMSGFGGSIEQLKSGIDVLLTSVGESLAPVIQKVVEAFQKLVDWFNNLSPRMQTVISVVGLLVAALGPVLVVVGLLISSIGTIITAVGVIGPLLAGLAGPITLVIGVIAMLIAIGVSLYKNWDTIKAKAKALWTNIKTTFTGIKTSITSTISSVKTWLSSAWSSIKTTAQTAWNKVKDAIVGPIKTARDTVKNIIHKVKDFFPINVGNLMSNIKLPHFSLKWSSKDFGPLGTLKYPTGINFDGWWAKGGIFDSPSIIGVGEAGPEAVVPLNKFWDKLDKMGENSGGIVININGYNKDPRELAQEIKRELIKDTNRQRLAWT